MVAFNSDWCPACLKMENRWNYFGDWCKDHDIAVGKVDIGASPILTGTNIFVPGYLGIMVTRQLRFCCIFAMTKDKFDYF